MSSCCALIRPRRVSDPPRHCSRRACYGYLTCSSHRSQDPLILSPLSPLSLKKVRSHFKYPAPIPLPVLVLVLPPVDCSSPMEIDYDASLLWEPEPQKANLPLRRHQSIKTLTFGLSHLDRYVSRSRASRESRLSQIRGD